MTLLCQCYCYYNYNMLESICQSYYGSEKPLRQSKNFGGEYWLSCLIYIVSDLSFV